MEFIIDLLFEIIVEGAVELSDNKKVPMPLRILALIVCLITIGAIIGMVYLMGYFDLMDGYMVNATFFFAIGSCLVIAFFYIIYKEFREREVKKEQTITEQICEAKSNKLVKIRIACILLSVIIISAVGFMYWFL